MAKRSQKETLAEICWCSKNGSDDVSVSVSTREQKRQTTNIPGLEKYKWYVSAKVADMDKFITTIDAKDATMVFSQLHSC